MLQRIQTRPSARTLIGCVLFAGLALPAFSQDPGHDHDHEHVEKKQHVRLPLPTPEEIAQLPADGGPEFNRLVHEQSPYLIQHARNPVDWYPWGPEAFAAAAAQDKPVFLSIGYSTCHWCHVMEHESFEDEEVAVLMNKNFICVKVDREERPDVDQVYMTFIQQVVGRRGGWPLTVLMTFEKKPFFAGTYFPKGDGPRGGGMLQLIPYFSQAWKNDRAGLLSQVEQAVEALSKVSGGAPGAMLTGAQLDVAFKQLEGGFDPARGGFGDSPKFPVPHNLRFLLRYARRTGNQKAITMVTTTLRMMRRGGIWDQVGKGFHRYSTDSNWFLPHFEKMLYDQALISMAAIEAWQVTGDDDLREIAEGIFEYVLRDMTSPDGGFYSAEDADSEGEEGLFYLWTGAELNAALGEKDGELAAKIWGVEEGGNFNEEGTTHSTGESILHLPRGLDELAKEIGVSRKDLDERIESMRSRLFAVREPRIHPLKDDKVLTDWNGLMIAAFALAGKAFDEPKYVQAARRAADFSLTKLRDDKGRLFKRSRLGSASLMGMLEDYSFQIWGLIETYEATLEPRYLKAATELADAMLAHFWDDAQGGFFLAPDDGETLIVRSKDIYDGAIPSGNSVAALNLLRLARLTGKTLYEERAEGIMKAFAANVERGPMSYTQLLMAVDFATGDSYEVVVVGDPEAEDTRLMLRALHGSFMPSKVVIFKPIGAGAEDIVALAPYTEQQVAVDGKATAYVCQNFTCQAPTNDIALMLEHLKTIPKPAEPEVWDGK